MEFPDLLIDGLWHTTSIQRFKKIVESGLILVYPDIPDTERWCTRGGEEHYPFVRHLEGISLFDFKDFHYLVSTMKNSHNRVFQHLFPSKKNGMKQFGLK